MGAIGNSYRSRQARLRAELRELVIERALFVRALGLCEDALGRRPMPGFKKTMQEFKAGTLHSGSKAGPLVTNPKQAKAIAVKQAKPK